MKECKQYKSYFCTGTAEYKTFTSNNYEDYKGFEIVNHNMLSYDGVILAETVTDKGCKNMADAMIYHDMLNDNMRDVALDYRFKNVVVKDFVDKKILEEYTNSTDTATGDIYEHNNIKGFKVERYHAVNSRGKRIIPYHVVVSQGAACDRYSVGTKMDVIKLNGADIKRCYTRV